MIWPSRQTGFTIVELLIVIVIIAVLAAISIVAFNGVQARAENTKTTSGVAGYIRALKTYSATNDALPVTATYVCLGESTSTCATIPSGSCGGFGAVSGNAAFVSALRTAVTTLPTVSDQTITCSGSLSYRGGIYYSDGNTATMWYFLNGNVDCGSPGGLTTGRSTFGSATRCYITFAK